MKDANPTSEEHQIPTSLWEKLFNILVSPGEVFEEVVASPPRLANWLVPTLFVCLSGIILLNTPAPKQKVADAIQQLVTTGSVPSSGVDKLFSRWQMMSALMTCAATFAGTFWSAFVLWFIGRIFLSTKFPFMKTVEVVSLAGIILVLGTICTVLLNLSNFTALPAISLLADNPDFSKPTSMALNAVNIFHLWAAAILAIGLSKLSVVSLKESAFWVFGYWVLIRMVLILMDPALSGGN